ncbi:hypothetical protein H7U28_15420, partial [Coprobacillus cateniformis]|nr:hypothetical protein [Coprobacillus cateniformis]
MNKKIKKILKKSKFFRKLHTEIVSDYAKQKEIHFNIDEITPLYGKNGVDNGQLRYNIAIPTLKKEFVFGGITT